MIRTPCLRAVLALAALALPTTGCQLGPQAMRMGHSEYASAVGEVSDKQLLLNLVRLRYRATPVWLEISSISSQFVMDASGSISGTLNENVGTNGKNPDSLGLSAGMGYSERPTISYTILGGEAFIKRMLTPIPVTGISLLAKSGSRADRLMRLTVERMNGLKNAPNASGPTPSTAPNYERFLEVVSLMFDLGRADMIDFEFATRFEEISAPIAVEKIEGDMLVVAKVGLEFLERDEGRARVLSQEQRILIMRVAGDATGSAEVERVRGLLHLSPDRMRYDIVDPADGDYDPLDADAVLSNISIDTRSLMGVLYYVSNAVEVPPDDAEFGPITRTLDDDGDPFDWSDLLGDIFKVHYSKSPPSRAAVSVRYRGNWFYIADDDESSLSTFALLNQLSSLTAGEQKGTAPVLTLPVGG